MDGKQIPDRFLMNRADIQQISEKYIRSHLLATICIGIGTACLGADVSIMTSAQDFYKKFLFWLFLIGTIVPIVMGICMEYLPKHKKDLLDEIYESAKKRSDYTGIFLVSRISPHESGGMPDRLSLMTEAHVPSGEVFLLYLKNLEKYETKEPGKHEHERVLNLDEIRHAFAAKVDGINPHALKIEEVYRFHEIKRTSGIGEEKMIRYVFFRVYAEESLQMVFEKKYTWRTLRALLNDPKAISYNLDVLTQIHNNIAVNLGDSFTKLEEFEPIKIIWNITNECKYGCEICATHSNRKELDDDAKYRALLNILSIGKDRIKSIDFSGGDPLSNLNTIDLILRAQSVIGKSKVHVTTTGEGIDYAKKHRSDMIHDLLANCEITVDEIDENEAYIRKEDNYCIKNRTAITQNAQAIGHLIVNVPILRPDMKEDSIQRLVDRIAEIKVANKSCTLIRLMKTGRMASAYPENYDPLHFIQCFKEYAEKKGLDVHIQCALYGAFYKETNRNSCTMFHKKVGIDCAGNVFACAWGGYVDENVETNPFFLGNVHADPLDRILNSDKALKLQDKIKKGTGCCRVFNYFEDSKHDITCNKDPLLGEKR